MLVIPLPLNTGWTTQRQANPRWIPAEYEDTETGAAGFFLYYSLQQFHAFMKNYHEKSLENTVKGGINIPRVQDDFEDKSSDDVNPAILVSGATTILAGLTVARPFLVGPATVVTGMASLFGNSMTGSDAGSDGGSSLSDKVLEQFRRVEGFVDNANGAVFGADGVNPDEAIVGSMQKQQFNHPSVRALGDGQWLVADATEGLEERMDAMYNRLVSSDNDGPGSIIPRNRAKHSNKGGRK